MLLFLYQKSVILFMVMLRMNKKYLNLLAVFALVCFFTLSLVFPLLKNTMKICALGVYALVSFLYIKEKKKEGENIEKDVLFSACVVLLLAL